MNKIVLVGRMTADAEMKQTNSGKKVTSFNIAVDRQFKGANGEKETDFITIVLWEKSAEFAVNYLGKGQRVAVEGTLQIRKYQDKDGQTRIAPEVIGNQIEGLEKKEQNQGAPAYAPAPQYQQQAPAYQTPAYQQPAPPAYQQQIPQYQQPAPAATYQAPPQQQAQAAAMPADDWGAPPMMSDMKDPFEDQ